MCIAHAEYFAVWNRMLFVGLQRLLCQGMNLSPLSELVSAKKAARQHYNVAGIAHTNLFRYDTRRGGSIPGFNSTRVQFKASAAAFLVESKPRTAVCSRFRRRLTIPRCSKSGARHYGAPHSLCNFGALNPHNPSSIPICTWNPNDINTHDNVFTQQNENDNVGATFESYVSITLA